KDVTKKLWGYPELLFQWEWQLGKILKAQGQKARGQSEQQEAIRAYGRAAGHLETARKNYASTTPTFSKDGETFYLERAELLLDAAKSARGEDKQNLLQTAIDSIESRQEAGLRNYFQDECVTEKSPVGEERRLQDNEVLLYLVMFGNRIESVLKFSDGSMQQETGLCNDCDKKDTLENRIKSFREQEVGEPQKRIITDYSEVSRNAIGETIIEPLKRGLGDHKINTLLIIPVGELLRVPFAALPLDQTTYLIQKYAIAILPNWRLSSAPLRPEDLIHLEDDRALLAGLTIEPPLSKMEIEQPEGKIDDSEVCLQRSKAVETVRGDNRSVCVRPLCFVDKEIKGVEGIIQNRTTLLGTKFTVGEVESILKNKDYSVIHFSTHGYFDHISHDSWLCTYNKDETLTINKIEELLQGKKVKLLTLSACQTALGAEMGLAGIGVKLGTRSALGSLWSVDDESTSQLIQHFYKNLEKESLKNNGYSIAKALQKAQLDFLPDSNNKPALSSRTDKNKIFMRPYYWAGFLLIGNWQNQ
ncbi:MAG: hypothetical protein BWK78_05000, partial [Thiotrichaceae bacterium IS1]